MAIVLYKRSGSTNVAAYSFAGLLSIEENITQNTPVIQLPRQTCALSIINTLFGQKKDLNMTFILIQRSDDYTLGTGSAGDGSPNAQKNYIETTMFTPSMKHRIVDADANVYDGRVTAFRIVKQSDEPLIYNCSISFVCGSVPTA